MLNEIITKIKDVKYKLKREKQRAIIFAGSFLLIIIIGMTLKIIFPSNPTEGRKIQKYNVITTYKGMGKEALLRPLGVTSDDNGNVYVADSSNHRIVVFSVDGKVERIIGKEGTANGELNYPTAVAIFEAKLYVTDSGNGRILIFSKDGDYIRQINSLKKPEKTKDDEIEFKPVSLTIDANENLYVTDGKGQRILVFNKEGQLTKTFGTAGAGNGQFAYPNGLALDEKNKRIFVSDFANSRIQVFNWEGKYLKQFRGQELFMNPRGLAYNEQNDQLFIADIFEHRITIINSEGKLINHFGQIGSTPNKFHFPNGLFFLKGNLYVTDRENHRIFLIKAS